VYMEKMLETALNSTRTPKTAPSFLEMVHFI
jgi:hypothetical protein